VHFAPRDPSTVHCRKCAYEQLSVRDPDDSDLRNWAYDCSRCGRSFELGKRSEDEKSVLCNDCFRGIESVQQDRAKRGKRVAEGVVRVARKPKK